MDSSSYQDKVLQDLQDIAGITDYEVSIINDVLDKIKEPLPSSLVGAQNKVSNMDAMRPILLNLIYFINKECIKANRIYFNRYNNEYKRLKKIKIDNKLSRDAMEAEIFAQSDVADLKDRVDYLEQIKWLLVGYQKSFDQVRLSTIERWNDNRRGI